MQKIEFFDLSIILQIIVVVTFGTEVPTVILNPTLRSYSENYFALIYSQ